MLLRVKVHPGFLR